LQTLRSEQVQTSPSSEGSETDPLASRGRNPYILVGGMIVLLILCVAITLLAQSQGQMLSISTVRTGTATPSMVLLASEGRAASGLLMALPGPNSDTDIYYVPAAPGATPSNLTESAGLVELLPSVSPDGTAVAFYVRDATGRSDRLIARVPPSSFTWCAAEAVSCKQLPMATRSLIRPG